MVPYLGDFAEDQSVFVAFNTFDSNDPSASVTITNLADTDIHIHKNDGTTQHSSATDVDVQINFDTITGNHMIEIRTTDVFFTTGADYFVRMEGTTVDAATINAWVAHFSIENRFTNVTKVSGTAQTANDNGADINAILVDTADMQPKLGTPAGASMSADIAAVKSDTAAILVDTADIQPKIGTPAADVSADIAAVKAETALVVADTNELQTDWVNNGRLDLILDAAATQTTADAIETDTQDIQSRLPAALVGGRMDSDVEAINNDTNAADHLAAHALTAVDVTFSVGGTTTTAVLNQVDGAGASSTNDVYNGRVLIFTAPAALKYQATDITDYDGGTLTATITAVTTGPGATATAIMV